MDESILNKFIQLDGFIKLRIRLGVVKFKWQNVLKESELEDLGVMKNEWIFKKIELKNRELRVEKYEW